MWLEVWRDIKSGAGPQLFFYDNCTLYLVQCLPWRTTLRKVRWTEQETYILRFYNAGEDFIEPTPFRERSSGWKGTEMDMWMGMVRYTYSSIGGGAALN